MLDGVGVFLISKASLKDLKLICVVLKGIKCNTVGVFLLAVYTLTADRDRQV